MPAGTRFAKMTQLSVMKVWDFDSSRYANQGVQHSRNGCMSSQAEPDVTPITDSDSLVGALNLLCYLGCQVGVLWL